jgi:hypothetical protein
VRPLSCLTGGTGRVLPLEQFIDSALASAAVPISFYGTCSRADSSRQIAAVTLIMRKSISTAVSKKAPPTSRAFSISGPGPGYPAYRAPAGAGSLIRMAIARGRVRFSGTAVPGRLGKSAFTVHACRWMSFERRQCAINPDSTAGFGPRLIFRWG